MRITFSVYDGKFLLHKDSLQCMTYGCHYFDARSFAFWQERKSYVHDYCLKEKYLSYLIFLGPGGGGGSLMSLLIVLLVTCIYGYFVNELDALQFSR